MFASSDRSTKRRIAGYLGGVLGASLLFLSVYPGIAAAAPALDKLTLTSMCTLPKGDAIFRVGNTNALAITYTWDINKTSFAGKALAPAGDSYLHVPSSSAGNTRIFVDGKQQASKAQNGKACVFHVQPVKRWVDASGADLAAPVVPKGWKLTLDSDLETLTCTWKKAALSCTSKVDAEDKGAFTNEKPNLDVPFGGSYTITETATPDFKQDGTGTFGPLDEPKDLDAYFAGADTFVVVVTNQSDAAIAATTTIGARRRRRPRRRPRRSRRPRRPRRRPPPRPTEPTTTTAEESTTTTVEEEPTTTTAEESTTTTVEEEPTTTTAEEPTTTTTVEGVDDDGRSGAHDDDGGGGVDDDDGRSGAHDDGGGTHHDDDRVLADHHPRARHVDHRGRPHDRAHDDDRRPDDDRSSDDD